MSGICGIIYFNEKPVGNEINVMIDRLRHRGPDGIDVWQKANAGLAHLMMHVTPESVYEKQPLVSESGLVLVADARIDNRDELIAQLSLVNGEASTDSELILAVYEQWGQDCVHYLIGDFAFVIWDKAKQQLFCGRDHIGARPLYYSYLEGEYFVFASEMKALLALQVVPNTLNEVEIASYIAALHDFRPFTGRTVYENITSLKPAYHLTINKSAIKEQFYWNLDLSKFDYLKTDADFVKAFRETFIEAVRCRIRTPFEVASHLSGGLDSSSVSCVAVEILQEENRLLHTFHMDVELDRCNEKAYAEAVIAEGSLKHQYTKISDFDFYEATNEITYMTDRPNSFVVTPPAQLGWMKAAQQVNARVFLTGHEGDTVVDYGFGLLEDTLLQGDYGYFEALLAQLSEYAVHYNYFDDISDWPLQKKQDFVRDIVLKPILGQLKQERKYKKIAGILLNTHRSTKMVRRFVVKKAKNQRIINKALGRKDINARFSILTDLFKTQTNVEHLTDKEYEAHHKSLPLTEKQRQHFQKLHCFGMTQFCEILEHCGVHHGFKMAHPFLDRRLLELAMVLPTTLNFNKGMMRGTLREAMKGILPEKVRTRTIKMDFSPLLVHTIVNSQPTFKSALLDNNSQYDISHWINHAELMTRIEVCKNPAYSNELKNALTAQIFRSLYFSIFYSFLNNQFYANAKAVPKTSPQIVGQNF